jgi:hypothetical protein
VETVSDWGKVPTKKKFKIVGWYSFDPNDQHRVPFARVVTVEAQTIEYAIELGKKKLDQMGTPEAIFLNWFTEEIK